MKKTLIIALAFLGMQSASAKDWTVTEVKTIITKVNDTWQQNHPKQERSFWDPAVYHTGNMEAAKYMNNRKWYQYSYDWAEQNLWQGARETDNTKWKYKTYGEGHQFVLFGDWQICFQTYIDLYNSPLAPADKEFMVKRAKEVMGFEAYSDVSDYWW